MKKTGIGEILLYTGIAGVVVLLPALYIFTSLFEGDSGLAVLTGLLIILNVLVIAGAELVYRRR